VKIRKKLVKVFFEVLKLGEFRLEIISDPDGRLEFTVNVIYIQGNGKLKN
jgi:hypothetical protein